MDYGFIIFAILSGVAISWWLVIDFGKEEEKATPVIEPRVVLSEADLKKKTKAQLLEVAESVGIEVDKKLTKAKIIAELLK